VPAVVRVCVLAGGVRRVLRQWRLVRAGVAMVRAMVQERAGRQRDGELVDNGGGEQVLDRTSLQRLDEHPERIPMMARGAAGRERRAPMGVCS